MHAGVLNRGKACIDSQVWARNQESMHVGVLNRGKACIDSQVWARNQESMHARGLKRGKSRRSSPARVYKRGSAGGKSEVFCVKVGSTVAAKRVLMRPEAAFPYVFAAEGAQHPPKKPPRSTTIAAATAKKKTPRNQPKPPQNPPGHSSYTMRGGQTVTPY